MFGAAVNAHISKQITGEVTKENERNLISIWCNITGGLLDNDYIKAPLKDIHDVLGFEFGSEDIIDKNEKIKINIAFETAHFKELPKCYIKETQRVRNNLLSFKDVFHDVMLRVRLNW